MIKVTIFLDRFVDSVSYCNLYYGKNNNSQILDLVLSNLCDIKIVLRDWSCES